MKKIVIILSGGLDSSTMLYYYKNKNYDVSALTFFYGQKHNTEIECAKNICRKTNTLHKVIDLNFMKDLLEGSNALTTDSIQVPTLQTVIGDPQPITYVPYRNQLMLSIALSYAETIQATMVCFGAQKHDEYTGYWDCTPRFVDAINNVSSLNRKNKIKVVAPFVEMSKSEEIILAKHCGLNFADTISCYKGTNCGECPTCKDRIKAFCVAGEKDPIKYSVDIPWEENIKKYKQDLKLESIVEKIKE